LHPTSTRRASGHSLLELTVVAAVVGVLASVAAVGFQQPSGQYLTLETDQLRRNLSHVQMLAISRSQRMKLSANGDHYAVQACESSACTAPVTLTDPATGRPFTVALQNGARITSAAPLYLDTLGRPASATGVVTSDPAVRFQLTLDGRTTQVDVAPLTGGLRATY
jgi:type II secretory pathway pseudopilin PulG